MGNYSLRNEYSGTEAVQISFFNKVYGLMTLGLLVTALVAHSVYVGMSPETYQRVMMPCLIAEIVMVFLLSATAMRLPSFLAVLFFFAYAALNGVTLSTVFLAYSIGSVAKVFYLTAGVFGAMALFGAVTGVDLARLGAICIIGLIGVILAGIVNFFLQSSALEFGCTVLGLLLFLGLVAYDTQKIRRIGEQGVNHTGLAVVAALSLYLDFINIFLYLLRLFGGRGGRRD